MYFFFKSHHGSFGIQKELDEPLLRKTYPFKVKIRETPRRDGALESVGLGSGERSLKNWWKAWQATVDNS
ncbi:unnamed protein product [Cuscuta campestris]|uniref:Uncharacterized protein n=1 Tax=Cuscuta campestris TaxID=132261 RepID=A0A484MAP4_9ASTE|nr:unnamed protein product [Cuscuta campestris]